MNGEKKRARLDQRRAPIHEALENFRQMRVVPFDVPGHKRGRGNPELTAFLGQQCVGVDVNSMKPLDNLCHPVSVIREAEELAADAFGAAHAFLMVGGTTSSVQSMVLTACKRGDEIILPRNVHRSVLNALVLCGAVPVYVNPEVDKRLGISLGMKREQVAKAIAGETGGDLYLLDLENPYTTADLDYNNKSSRVYQEHDDPRLRNVALKNAKPANWQDYDTVFVGYPIWWGIAAWPMDTFVKSNDFTGKTVIPFATSGGSGIEKAERSLKSHCPQANWKKGKLLNHMDAAAWTKSVLNSGC